MWVIGSLTAYFPCKSGTRVSAIGRQADGGAPDRIHATHQSHGVIGVVVSQLRQITEHGDRPCERREGERDRLALLRVREVRAGAQRPENGILENLHGRGSGRPHLSGAGETAQRHAETLFVFLQLIVEYFYRDRFVRFSGRKAQHTHRTLIVQPGLRRQVTRGVLHRERLLRNVVAALDREQNVVIAFRRPIEQPAPAER